MASSVVRAKGQVTIPTEIRRALGLKEGDPIEFEMTEDGILLKPQRLIDASQAWFWTAGWQAGEREASADITAGRVTRYENAGEFLAALGKAKTSKPPARSGRAPGKATKRP